MVWTQGSQVLASGSPVAHSEWLHVVAPQSAAQVPAVSEGWQVPLPQSLAHAPQSPGQVVQDSAR